MFDNPANSALGAMRRASERAQQNTIESMRHNETMSLERQKVNAETESARQLQKQTLQ